MSSRPLRLDRETDILGIVDVQPTFMPGGELPVADGAAVVPIINHLLENRFANAFATQDWHPADHVSFARSHPGHENYDRIQLPYGEQILWPVHAVQNTPNAGLHPDLSQHHIEIIIRKGWRREIDSYSAFFENDGITSTGLKGALQDRGISRIFFAGLAADFCVTWSAEHAVMLGFETYIIEDGTRGIKMATEAGETTMIRARRRLEEQGVCFLHSTELE
jgi:nicotinamidase/pyrazinamidase